MSGTRNVTNITLRQPTSTSAIMSLHGHFEVLSLSGSFLPPPAPPTATGLTIYLVGGQGQIMGGNVIEHYLVQALFNVAYERLPLEEELPQLPILGDAIGSSPDVVEAQHSLEESNVPLFHRLPSNLLNSIQLPSEAFWATGGRPPF
ncbi:DNA-binding family protein [Gossypium australe]|uniref:DNA-binding family protein n=1 Tax=Gossypium australe TaxID=47621 RepID=A0A5B6W2S2_9ROSI|nr:DNA-binding family protein [Gossypium australe]